MKISSRKEPYRQKINEMKTQNFGLLFLPVYLVSFLMAAPLLLCLYFALITNSFLFTIFFDPFLNLWCFSLFIFASLASSSTSYSASSSISLFPFT